MHRDVKPGNVLVEGERCYLTDFGLTRRMSSTTALTRHDEMVGTLDYVAPEQIAGDPVDARADVYSLGCLLFHMLAGEVPFPRGSQVAIIYAHLQDPPRALAAQRPDLPEALDAVVAKALAKRREERYASCPELVAAAREALGQRVQAAPLRLLSRAAGHTVLIAVEQAGVRASIRGMLGSDRFSYETAGHGAEALAFARELRPDVLVLDWELPGLPAAALCRMLRADPRTANVSVLVVADRAAAPDREALAEAGADALLVRPFSSLQLQLAVGHLLARGAGTSG